MPATPKVSSVSKKDSAPDRLIRQALRRDDEQIQTVVPASGTDFEGIGSERSNAERISTAHGAKTGANDNIPDTTAERTGTKPPRFLSDDELIVELIQRGKSANLIADIIGGKRADVLEKVRKLKQNA